MNTFKFLFAALLLSSSAVAQEPLKIVTYNMQGMRPGSNWQVRLIFMIQYFEALDPDVICLQEINETQSGGGEDNMARSVAEALEEHFGTPYFWYFTQTHIAWDEFREGVGIVSKHPALAEGARSLPRGTFLRKVAWNSIDSPLGIVNVFSTHLSYLPGHDSVRVAQVGEIMAYISEIESSNPSVGAVLGGDFNTDPPSNPIQLLVDSSANTFYYDTFAEVNPAVNGFTMPSNAPEVRIDYLFLRNTGGLQIETSQIVMDEPYSPGNYASDHLGVMTLFSRSPESSPGRGSLPRNIELYQIFPNPFNSTATITFFLPYSQEINLSLFDVTGRYVQNITHSQFPAGEHSFQINAAGLSSGLYFAAAFTPAFSTTQKLVLLK